jgi:signal transduction histidine kinase
VARVKVYNRKGTVVFSTKLSQIGRDQSDNPAFAAALNGQITSRLIYRDTFNSFDDVTEEDNLIQTYLPVQAGPAEPVEGVFEIYTDVNHLVAQNERTLFIIMLGAGAVLAALYGILVLLVRYARGIIDEQQQTIRERTATLEVLSAQMLKSEEMEKKKMAFELHEGLAQTLSAIKVLVEDSRQRMAADDAKSLEAIVPVLQDTIREVRTMATELRPSSLDDLGLLPAIREFSGRFEAQYPDIRLEQDVAVEEQAIPPALKVVLYRIIESALKALAQPGNTERIRFSLRPAGRQVKLEIDDVPKEPDYAATGADDGELQMRFADMQERAILSGGVFSMERNDAGGVTLRAAWGARGA